jgi:iron complex outermembrane receptor protein
MTNPNAIPEVVIITASPFAQSNLDIAASVSQLPREILVTNGGAGLGDALKQVPGVTTSGFTAGSNRPIIRGLGTTRVRVTENGIGTGDVADVGDDHGVPVDPLSALEVEILRGPATLRYGSQAIGGVVNAITNRVPIDLGEGASFEGLGSIGTNGEERLGSGLVDYRQGHWGVHADGFMRGVDDYDTPDGTQTNTFAFSRGYALGGAYIGDDQSAGGLGFNEFVAHYGSPTEPGADDKVHIHLDTKHYNGAFRFNAPVPGISRITAGGGYTDYFHDEISDLEGTVAHFTNKEWEGRIEVLHDPFGPITNGAIGFQYGNRNFAVSGPESDYLHPTKTRNPAAYIFEEFGITNQLSLQGAARVEWNNVKGDTDALGFFNRDFTPVSLSGGIVFRPMQTVSLFANVSHVERAPNPVELFAQGAHDASHTFETGDPNLGLEKALSFEGGVKYQDNDGSTASFSIYHTKYKGFIDGFLTGNSCDDDGACFPDDTHDFDELFYRQNDATFWGLEAQAHWHVGDIGMGRWGIDAQADYVRATLKNLGNVPRIPPFRFGGGLFYESTFMALRAGVLRVETQDKVEAHETETEGFTTVDASAVFHVYRGDEGDVDIALIGSNLTDSVQRNHVSFNKEFVLQPGRTFRLVLHYMR